MPHGFLLMIRCAGDKHVPCWYNSYVYLADQSCELCYSVCFYIYSFFQVHWWKVFRVLL